MVEKEEDEAVQWYRAVLQEKRCPQAKEEGKEGRKEGREGN